LVALLATEGFLIPAESAHAAASDKGVASEMAEFSQQIGAARQALSQKLNQLDQELQAQQIGPSDKLQAELDALKEEYESESNLFDGESQLDGLSPAQSRQIVKEMRALDLDYRARVAEAKRQAKNPVDPVPSDHFEAIAPPAATPPVLPTTYISPPPTTGQGDDNDPKVPPYLIFGALGAGLVGGLIAMVGTEKKSQVSP
jgi:hypothetical protein